MSSSIQSSLAKNSDQLVGMMEEIKHNLDNLKILIPSHPLMGGGGFDYRVNELATGVGRFGHYIRELGHRIREFGRCIDDLRNGIRKFGHPIRKSGHPIDELANPDGEFGHHHINELANPDGEFGHHHINELANGIREYGHHFNELANGIGEFGDGINELGNDVGEFSHRIREFGRHFNELKNNIRKFGHPIDKLANDIGDFRRRINELADDIGKFSYCINELVNDINRAKEFTSQANKEFRENDCSEISERLQRVFNRVEQDIIADGEAMKSFEVSYGHLDKPDRICSLFLSIFPENAIIVRRPLIHWWIGEGLIESEEKGEEIFENILKYDLIVPYGNGKSPHVNKCQIRPWIRYMLISLAKKANLFEFDLRGTLLLNIDNSIYSRRACLTVDSSVSLENGKNYNKSLATIFNINEKYIPFDSTFLAKLKKLVVLQLGRWHGFQGHHIEIMSGETLLRELGTHKHLKYLSLRGVLKVTSLPHSIFNLTNLEILDLKACYNLRKLPPNISSLRKLTHFDVSDCYLLESMPKGLDKLTSLQVLKGHIIGSSTPTPSKISHLINLKKLKRLSIYVEKNDMKAGQLDKLKDLTSVRSLKISWVLEEEKKSIVEQSLTFPEFLEKLKLANIPEENPKWLIPQNLPNLKKLHILGGKLSSLDNVETGKWKVEILHLLYLKNLKIGLLGLEGLFPLLKYVLTKFKEGYASETSEIYRSYVDLDDRSKEDSKFPSV